MNFPLIVQHVIDYVIYLVNENPILDLGVNGEI